MLSTRGTKTSEHNSYQVFPFRSNTPHRPPNTPFRIALPKSRDHNPPSGPISTPRLLLWRRIMFLLLPLPKNLLPQFHRRQSLHPPRLGNNPHTPIPRNQNCLFRRSYSPRMFLHLVLHRLNDERINTACAVFGVFGDELLGAEGEVGKTVALLGYDAETTGEEGLFDVVDCFGGCGTQRGWVYF